MAGLIQLAAHGRDREVAVVDTAAGSVRWAELDRRVNRWIWLLREAGLATGDRLAVFAGNRREVYEAVLACLHTGVVAVPVNWHLTAPEVSYLLDDAGCRGLVVDPERSAVASEAVRRSGRRPGLRLVLGPSARAGFAAAEPSLAAQPAGEPARQRSGATMLYTSGTTGHPKGVVNDLLVAGAPLERVSWLVAHLRRSIGLPAGGRQLLAGPWYHSAQLFFTILPLLGGSRLVIADRLDPATTLRLLDQHRITDCNLVPTQFTRLLRLDRPAREAFHGTSLRRVWHGGGPCPVQVKRQMIQWWGPVFTEYYAATEGGIATLIDSADWLDRVGSVGRPVPPTRLMIAGPDGTALPPGAEGTVYLRRSPDRDFHYHNAPDKTAAAHLAPGTFTYGDLGYLDQDGFLFLTGRSADTIVSGGVNIYPAEVEAVLQAHPAVHDVAVLGVPDAEFGERVKAFVQPEPAAPGVDEGLFVLLDEHCRRHLAGFKVPRRYELVSALPRDASGKLRRQSLRAERI